MRSLRQPTRFTLEKATDLGRLMAMTEPRLVALLRDAHQYTGYVEFLQAHRHRLEQDAVFTPWDVRLNRLIEGEGKTLGFVLTDRDDWDELAVSIAGPIRCAFWYGWETVQNLKTKYDQHVHDARLQDHQMQVIHVRDAVDAPQVIQTVITEEADDAFWDSMANDMLASLGSADTPPAPPAPSTPNH